MTFLASRESRPLTGETPADFTPLGLFLGPGQMGLEVAAYRCVRQPANVELESIHDKRVRGRTAPVVIAVLWGEGRAALAASGTDEPFLARDLDASQVERLCDAALSAPDRHVARRLLAATAQQLDAKVPGLRNSGLFALHELENGVPARGDWAAATKNAAGLLAIRGRALVERLGFAVQALPGPGAAVLVARGAKIAVAVFLERPDEIDPPSQTFDGNSPVSYGLAQADRENLDFVVIAAGPTLRVYPVKPGVGVARRGRAETFIELNLNLLAPQHAGYLWMVASADALVPDGTFQAILEASAHYAADLGSRLRERVYQEVVPSLASAIVRARRLRDRSPERLRETYESALLVLFRLLFVAYAEDKELLPLHANAEYRRHSLKELATRLAHARSHSTAFADEDFYWTEVNQVWKAVDKGNRTWGVPPYNGGLFSAEEGAGAALDRIRLTDSAFAPALAALLLDKTAEGVEGPIDFRSLGVREFGTIYEGLLEGELSIAETDLALDPKDAYVPLKGRAAVVVREGEVYLHNASGSRKSSGAYYTKHFAVEHLLERSLEPALTDHLARVQALDDSREASAAFFSFHVADIAMGSGHFLVAAIDHIERGFSNYLASRHLPGVKDELERLRASAQEQLGPEWAGEPIEDTRLLRRQIARRCVFGVDLNPLAVELARLSIWIHTFVPGLPLSFLDANLVVGNSLVGIATFDEANDLIGAQSGDLFADSAFERLQSARAPMEKLARLAEATAAEVKEAKRLYAQAREKIKSEEDLLTVLAASRIDDAVAKQVGDGNVATRLAEQGDMFSDALIRKAERALDGLQVLHFPIVFPQVFLGKRGGFDVIVGNPPWDKVRFEEDAFFGRHIPGLIGLDQADRKVAIQRLLKQQDSLGDAADAARRRSERLQAYFSAESSGFRLQGSGHLDTAKLFTERFLQLVARDGYLGFVLTRQALVLEGWGDLRRELFRRSQSRFDQLRNTRGWLFEDAEHRYLIALVCVKLGEGVAGRIEVSSGARSLADFLRSKAQSPIVWDVADLSRATGPDCKVPLLLAPGDAELFVRLRQTTTLGSEEAGALQAYPYAVLDVGKDLESIGERANGVHVLRARNVLPLGSDLSAKCRRLSERGLKDFLRAKILGADWADRLRESPSDLTDVLGVVYRYPSTSDNSRTLIATLLPDGAVPATGYVHSLVQPLASTMQRMATLALLNSLVWDWLARRVIDRHVTASVLTGLPLPSSLESTDVVELAGIAAQLLAVDANVASRLSRFHSSKAGATSLESLRVQLDVLAARLFRVSRSDMEMVLADFSETGVAADSRQAILSQL